METKGSPHIISKVKESAGKGWASLKDFAYRGKDKELVHRGWDKLRKFAGREKKPDHSKELAGMDILGVLSDTITQAKDIRAHAPTKLHAGGEDISASRAKDQAEIQSDLRILDTGLERFKRLPQDIKEAWKGKRWSNNRLTLVAPEHPTRESMAQGKSHDFPSKELIQIVLKSMGALGTDRSIDDVFEAANKLANKEMLTDEQKQLGVRAHVDGYKHLQINLPSKIPGATVNLAISPPSSSDLEWGASPEDQVYIMELFMDRQTQEHLVSTAMSEEKAANEGPKVGLLEAI